MEEGLQVANVAAGKRGAQNAEGTQLTSFGSDIESHPPTESLISTQSSSELGRAAAASVAASGALAQVAALQTENKLLKARPLSELSPPGAFLER